VVHGSRDCGVEGRARATRGGQPRYSALAITTALTLRRFSAWRSADRRADRIPSSLLGLDLADQTIDDQPTG